MATKTLMTDIAKAIKAGEKDSKINEMILQYKEDWGINLSLQDWKSENTDLLRSWAYPPLEDFLDAMVKINSGDERLEAEGRGALVIYVTHCIAVKAKYKKVK
jgi:hypothetical protein